MPVYSLIRADDQVDLTVEVQGATLVVAGPGYQLKPGPTGGQLALGLAPQHVQEAAVDLGATTQRPVFGYGSTVVFRLPPNGPPIPFSVAGILAALPGMELVTRPVGVAPAPPPLAAAVPAATLLSGTGADPLAERRRRAESSNGPTTEADAISFDEAVAVAGSRSATAGPETSAAPTTDAVDGQAVTALHLPSRLELTPRPGATRFRHAAEPVRHDDRVELWHTRLALRRQDGTLVEAPADLIAWATHELPTGGLGSWRTQVGDPRISPAVDAAVRQAIVTQTQRPPAAGQTWTNPIVADQLMLSPLGSWLDASGDWSFNDSLRSYRHRIANGRDVEVRTVELGKLFPLGHGAIMTTTTVRRFEPTNGLWARLEVRKELTVRKRTVTFGTNDDRRRWPWKSVTLPPRITPPGPWAPFLNANSVTELPTIDGTKPYLVDCVGVDRGDRTTYFQMPLVFVPQALPYSESVSPLATKWKARPEPEFHTIPLGGQVVSVAPPSPDAPDLTDVLAESIEFGFASWSEDIQHPIAKTILGTLPALQRFAPAVAAVPMKLTHADAYLDDVVDGFHPVKNAGELVLQLAAGQAAPLVDLAGQLATGGVLPPPSFMFAAMSRVVGPAGGKAANAAVLQALATGKIPVAQLLRDVVGDSKLLGVFPLIDLIGAGLSLDLRTQVPKLVTHALDGVNTPSLHWSVPLFTNGGSVLAKPLEVGPASGRLRPFGDGATLELDVVTELVKPVNPTAPRMRTTSSCTVRNVEMALSWAGEELVVVPLKRLSFRSVDGEKPHFDVDMGRIQFFGILGLLATLAELLPDDAFSDPPAIEVLPDRIVSTLSLPIPSVGFGVFSLENLSFGAELNLFFSAPPKLSLNFATPDNPFRVSVLALSGGGYVQVALTTAGMHTLAAGVEFGASVSINIAVAKASVSVMGGIYFGLTSEDGHNKAEVRGYVRVRGEVSVLFIASVSVEAYLGMTYYPSSGRLIAEGHLAASARILFVRKTVRVPISYTFDTGHGGSGNSLRAAPPTTGLPGFTDLMDPQDWTGRRPWDTYCQAFA